MAEELRWEHLDPRPKRDFRKQLRDEIIEFGGSGRLFSTLWNLDWRDPTADRRLIELCFSMPAEAMYSGSSDRPAFEAAFADRLPRRVLENRTRAYQQADWFEIFDPDDVRSAFAHYRRNSIVAELVDFNEVDAMIDEWPTDTKWMADLKSLDGNGEKFRTLLLTLSFANFIDVNFPDR
jgi:asparagine synthase (glutamine-hydrolysing)